MLLLQKWCRPYTFVLDFLSSRKQHVYIVPLDMKGCICHFVKWQIHPFISKGTTCIAVNVLSCWKSCEIYPAYFDISMWKNCITMIITFKIALSIYLFFFTFKQQGIYMHTASLRRRDGLITAQVATSSPSLGDMCWYELISPYQRCSMYFFRMNNLSETGKSNCEVKQWSV